MSSAEMQAFKAAARVELFGQQQQAAGAAGADPRTHDLLELVSGLRDDLPGADPADLEGIGAALFEWSTAMYHLGAAEAEGTETYEDGLRVGQARAVVTRWREQWLLPLLAAFGRGTRLSESAILDGLTPEDRAWVLDGTEEVGALKRERGPQAAAGRLIALIRSAPSEPVAGALAVHVGQEQGVWLDA